MTSLLLYSQRLAFAVGTSIAPQPQLRQLVAAAGDENTFSTVIP